jgi:uncharacterized protein (TIGR02246 family)
MLDQSLGAAYLRAYKEVGMFDESAERRAILALGHDVQDAWNRGDAAGYASMFTEDASFVAWNGLRGYGRPAIEEAHRRLFAGALAGSQMVLTGGDDAAPDSLRFLQQEVAIMVTVGAVTTAGPWATGADHHAVQTFVLVKNHNRWRITAFHNTRRQDQP